MPGSLAGEVNEAAVRVVLVYSSHVSVILWQACSSGSVASSLVWQYGRKIELTVWYCRLFRWPCLAGLSGSMAGRLTWHGGKKAKQTIEGTSAWPSGSQVGLAVWQSGRPGRLAVRSAWPSGSQVGLAVWQSAFPSSLAVRLIWQYL